MYIQTLANTRKHMYMRSERVEGLVIALVEGVQVLWWETPQLPAQALGSTPQPWGTPAW